MRVATSTSAAVRTGVAAADRAGTDAGKAAAVTATAAKLVVLQTQLSALAVSKRLQLADDLLAKGLAKFVQAFEELATSYANGDHAAYTRGSTDYSEGVGLATKANAILNDDPCPSG